MTYILNSQAKFTRQAICKMQIAENKNHAECVKNRLCHLPAGGIISMFLR